MIRINLMISMVWSIESNVLKYCIQNLNHHSLECMNFSVSSFSQVSYLSIVVPSISTILMEHPSIYYQ